ARAVPPTPGGPVAPGSQRPVSDTPTRIGLAKQLADEARANDPDDVALLPLATTRPLPPHHERVVELPVVDPRPVSSSRVAALSPHEDESPRAETGFVEEDRARAPLETIESDYAGAFFLINVAIDLGLYSHGITVVDDLNLSIWRFIELVARECLGEHDPHDALWTLLTDLAEPVGDQTLQDGPPDLSAAERAHVVGRVRSHLETLLDVEEPGGFLSRRRGHITRTASHLDVTFPLKHHPIEIRFARLDRNPGWIPA